MAMKLEYVKVANFKKSTDCPHNNALVCESKNCHKCGWHPDVAKRRMDKILSAKTEG